MSVPSVKAFYCPNCNVPLSHSLTVTVKMDRPLHVGRAKDSGGHCHCQILFLYGPGRLRLRVYTTLSSYFALIEVSDARTRGQ